MSYVLWIKQTNSYLENILVRTCQSILVLAPSADPALVVGKVLKCLIVGR